MEEIQSRFEIIRLAAGLGDRGAIDHQVTMLRNFSTDTKLHAILDELENNNLRQALYAMRDYLDALETSQSFFDPSPATEKSTPAETERGSVERSDTVSGELFGLDDVDESVDTERILGVEDLMAMTKESAAAPRTYAPAPSTEESLTASDAATATDDEVSTEEGLFDWEDGDETSEAFSSVSPEVSPTDKKSSPPVSDERPSEAADDDETGGLFDLDAQIRAEEDETIDREEPYAEHASSMGGQDDVARPPETVMLNEEAFEPVSADQDATDETSVQTAETTTEPLQHDSEEAVGVLADPFASQADVRTDGSRTASEPTIPDLPEPAPDEPRYEAFAYMGQKFRNMLHQFPQKEPYEEGIYIEAERFIDRVSHEDYTESQVEAMVARYQTLKEEGRIAEAAQVLIAAATTESKFAQFVLARELFKGDVLQADHAEAFTQINKMAEEDYPEAICDLGQLYEHGIGIDKNKRHALLLYEEAANLGIERARRHYERLKRANPLGRIGSLFSRR